MLRGTDLLNVSGTDIGSRYDLLVGLGSISVCNPNNTRFANLSEYQNLNDWSTRYFSYDLKNELEDLKSSNFDALGFPELFFFQPEIVFTVKSNVLSVYYFESVTSKDRIDALLQELMDCSNYTRTIPRNIIF